MSIRVAFAAAIIAIHTGDWWLFIAVLLIWWPLSELLEKKEGK